MDGRYRIVVDAMGGDHAPAAVVQGAVKAVKEQNDLQVILVGKEDLIRKELRSCGCDSDRIRIVGADEVIGMAEPPVAAIRTKKNSSLVVGMKLVHDQEADAFISAGSSGAVLVGAQVIVGRIRGIQRPPFASIIPTEEGCSLLLDCGANVDARPEHLVQFARLGSIYMENVMGISQPRVGLVNIGVEEEKGNELTKAVYPLLKDRADIHFIGNVEARDIPAGGCDVLVCEAFAGNMVLKMYEGTAKVLMRALKKGLMSSLKAKIGALLIKGTLKDALSAYDTKKYGGAPVLGLKGLVMKMHGSATAGEVYNTLLQSMAFIRADVTGKMQQYALTEGETTARQTGKTVTETGQTE